MDDASSSGTRCHHLHLSLTLKHTDSSGQVHTGIQGFLYYLTPNLEGLTVQRFLQILLDAMSQLFFSPQRVHGNHDHLRFLCKT